MSSFLVLAIFSGCSSTPKTTFHFTSELAAERARMLANVQTPPRQTLAFENLGAISSRSKRFLEFYRQKIWPHDVETAVLSYQIGLLSVLGDRALLDSTEQRKAHEASLLALNSDSGWRAALLQWFGLSKGLRGELADHARFLYEATRTELDSPQAQLLQKQLSEVYSRIRQADNNSPFNLTYGAASRSGYEIQKRFAQGGLDLDQATAEIEKLQATGLIAMGQDLAIREGQDLNELAVLRTRLAQAKGCQTWARCQVAEDAKGYGPGFRTVPERLGFLRARFTETEKAFCAFLTSRTNGRQFRAAAIQLLLSGRGGNIEKYFPVAKAEAVWRQMVLANGFDERVLSEIHLDTEPRPGKFASGYSNAVSTRRPKVVRIDAKTLNMIYPAPEDTQSWIPAEIYVLLGLTYDGTGPYKTLFHEGGHALDYAHRESQFEVSTPYAYTETASMMMETQFFNDPDFLKSMGVPIELVSEIGNNRDAGNLVELRTQIATGLIELLLWDYDYTQPSSERFVDRALRLFGEYMHEATGASYETRNGLDWRMSVFSQNRFYAGKVRFIAYLLADLSAKFTADALREKLLKASGRATLYEQPQFGPLLVKGLWRRGFRDEFPKAIERFSGKIFQIK